MESNEYVIVRTVNAGVFAGTLAELSMEAGTAVLTDARRLWYWAGAASLSQLAMAGTSKPESCKFPVAVSKVALAQVIEVLAVTDTARASIEAVPEWSA